jgi:hypothetical protein
MNHGLAQVFGAGLSSRLTECALVGCTVVVEDQWMIYGDVRRALLKIAYRINARGHHVAEQLIGVRDRTAGAINEASLDSVTRLEKARAIGRSERPDVQRLNSFGTLGEHLFCFAPAPAFFHCAGVFCATKLSAEFIRAATTSEKPNSDAACQHHCDSDDYGYLCRAMSDRFMTCLHSLPDSFS